VSQVACSGGRKLQERLSGALRIVYKRSASCVDRSVDRATDLNHHHHLLSGAAFVASDIAASFFLPPFLAAERDHSKGQTKHTHDPFWAISSRIRRLFRLATCEFR